MIFRTPFFLPWVYPRLLWRMNPAAKDIFLTFDDGPIPGPTEFVLNELSRANAKATFFCIGDNVRKYPDVFRRIVNEGHAVGNHTFHHMKGWSYSADRYIEDVRLCKEAMTGAETELIADKGNKENLFRPPYGRIRRSQISGLSNYTIVMWDVLTHDYSKNFSPEECLQGSVKATRPGSIVVFHDSIKAERNLSYALPRFLNHFGELGYSFKAIANP